MPRTSLGEFEHQVMLSLLRLGRKAHTAPIVLELEEQSQRPIRTAAVYIVLRRLEDKGLIRSSMTNEGDDARERRLFQLTRKGKTSLRDARATYLRLWNGLEDELEQA
jgi:DNA-binding PadR family transcriptional regulator